MLIIKRFLIKSYRKILEFTLPRRRQFVNITPRVEEALAESGAQKGFLLYNAMNITAAMFINNDESGNDDESGLYADMEAWLEKLAPEKP